MEGAAQQGGEVEEEEEGLRDRTPRGRGVKQWPGQRWSRRRRRARQPRRPGRRWPGQRWSWRRQRARQLRRRKRQGRTPRGRSGLTGAALRSRGVGSSHCEGPGAWADDGIVRPHRPRGVEELGRWLSCRSLMQMRSRGGVQHVSRHVRLAGTIRCVEARLEFTAIVLYKVMSAQLLPKP